MVQMAKMILKGFNYFNDLQSFLIRFFLKLVYVT